MASASTAVPRWTDTSKFSTREQFIEAMDLRTEKGERAYVQIPRILVAVLSAKCIGRFQAPFIQQIAAFTISAPRASNKPAPQETPVWTAEQIALMLRCSVRTAKTLTHDAAERGLVKRRGGGGGRGFRYSFDVDAILEVKDIDDENQDPENEEVNEEIDSAEEKAKECNNLHFFKLRPGVTSKPIPLPAEAKNISFKSNAAAQLSMGLDEDGGIVVEAQVAQVAKSAPAAASKPTMNLKQRLEAAFRQFREEYPRQVNPDDETLFLQYVRSDRDIETLFENLAAWKLTGEWQRGCSYGVEKFFKKGLWKTRPKGVVVPISRPETPVKVDDSILNKERDEARAALKKGNASAEDLSHYEKVFPELFAEV